MNVLINGASGYIGYHLLQEMLSNGHIVYAVCRNNKGFLVNIPKNQRLIIITCSQEELIDRIKKLQVDVWYQLLWEGACGELRKSAEVQIKNEIMAANAMETAHNIGCSKIIYTGTIYEHLVDDILSAENFNGSSFYIIAKKHASEITEQLAKKLGIKSIWCRFCHPIGRYMNENQMFAYAVKRFISNEVTEFSSCNQYFDIVSVSDLVRALRFIGEGNPKKNMYYLGSNSPRKLREYIEQAASICGYKREIGFGKRTDDGLVFKKEWFDASDFEREFGTFNQEGFEGGVESMIHYLGEERYEKFL